MQTKCKSKIDSIQIHIYQLINKYTNQPSKLRVAGLSPVFRSSENQIVIARFLSDFCF